MPKFRTRLLAHYEERHTTAIIEVVENAGGGSAREKLELLAARAVSDAGADLGVAVRAWAKQDSEAAAMQERVDATRIQYLQELCAQIGHASPERMARLFYLVLIGGAHVMPPLPAKEMRGLYELLLPLLDAEEGAS